MNLSPIKRVCAYSLIAVAASSATLLAVRARAAGIPAAAALTYTGYLEDPDGKPVTTTKGIGISLYADETGRKEVCGVKPADIEPVSGRFQIALPDDCTAAVSANPKLWVEVEVEGSLLGRTKLGAVPYAIEAGRASEATGALDARIAEVEAKLKNLANKADVPIVTAWQSYVPVLSTSAGSAVPHTSTTAQYRRVGDSVEVFINVTFDGVPASGAVYYQWSLPNELSIDAAKLPAGIGGAVVGAGYANKGVANNATLAVWPRSAKTVSASASGASTYYVNDSAPWAMDSTSNMQIFFTVPISGWTTTTP